LTYTPQGGANEGNAADDALMVDQGTTPGEELARPHREFRLTEKILDKVFCVSYHAKSFGVCDMLQKRIADKIRSVRTTRGLTLAHMAEATGLSKGLLSRIENSQVSPPIATLAKISRALEVPMSFFFEDEEADERTCSVIRKNERKLVIRKGSKIGFSYYSLTDLKRLHIIEPFVVKFPVIRKEATALFDHPGEEFLFVLKGKMELVYGKERIRLEAGDAVHFDSTTPHRGQNIGKQESECLVIVLDKERLRV
jgi:transcriptional regulator with XRE-family HTH domain